MRYLTRVTIFVTLLAGMHTLAWSASPAQDPKETGTITGRVTIDGKPAQGVIVMATPSDSDPTRMVERMFNPSVSPKATTDSDGRYRLEGMPPGRYSIAPAAPTLTSSDGNDQEQEVTVVEDATVERIDFSLTRGGVITGKVTDNEGHPVIGEKISLKPVDSSKNLESYSDSDDRMYSTDDRGIYRIFGLGPGRYLVSAGKWRDPFSRRPKRAHTYYPGVTDEAKAKPVEVIAGAEASSVDIRFGVADKGFTVSGRVIDGETGAPMANAMVAHSPGARESVAGQIDNDDSFNMSDGVTTTNARGEFRIDSLAPGKYKARVQSMGAVTGGSEFYADPVNFEVQSTNLDKLEIKVHRGASITGVVVVENADGPDTPEQLAHLILFASITATLPKPYATGMGRVGADGSFRIGGLKPGKAKIGPVPYGPQRFSLLRVERNGVEQHDAFDIQQDEQITGVRVIVVPANCTIRGHVTIEGGPLSHTSEMLVSARPLNNNDIGIQQSFPVDAKGNFVIDNVAPGEYEVGVSVRLFRPDGRRTVSAKQTVTVTSGITADVSLLLNLSVPDK